MGSSSSTSSRQFTAEFLGTLFLVTAGSGMAAYTTLVPTPYAVLAVAATFGAALGIVITLGGKISGAHINPAVSVAAVLAGHLKRVHFLPYITSQLLGAVAAGIILWLTFPASPESGYLGSTALATNIGPFEGVLLEAVGTFFLASAALYASSAKLSPPYPAVLVGGTLFFIILAIGPLTGASVNPARSIGPAFVSGFFKDLHVYVAGPLIGGGVAAMLQRRRVET